MNEVDKKVSAYVNRYATSRGISVEEAKRHKVVENYREYVQQQADKSCTGATCR